MLLHVEINEMKKKYAASINVRLLAFFIFKLVKPPLLFLPFHFSFDDFDMFPVKGSIENWDILVCKSNGTSAVVSEPWQYDEIAVTGKLFAKGKNSSL